jgi:hypothetical protein
MSEPEVFTVRSSALERCPERVMTASHWRPDGTCLHEPESPPPAGPADHGDDCAYCTAGEAMEHQYEPVAEEEPEDIWAGAELISVYTRAEAIEDGVLVDVSETAREAGIRYPVAMTRGAWEELVAWKPENKGIQDEAGRLWDVLTMLRFAARRSQESRIRCEVQRVPNTPEATQPRLAEFFAVCGPGDSPEPVITLMLEGED